MSNSDKYPVLMRLMHWTVGLVILGIIASGWFMVGLEDNVSYKYDIYHLHKSFGVLVIFLLFARLVIRWASKIPKLPDTMPAYEIKLGTLVHWLLYLFMFLVPVSGYMMSDAGGRDVPLFNLVMPSFLENNRELAGLFHDIHVTIPYVLLAIVVLHVLATIKHRYFDKPEHDVLHRML
ncbi:cytochrome b [Endozoicomonas sp. SESOKO1]|uniref:cytochrome b n=1 Tax=Endozoicomonas sp. SESOKO1 TaxID=2828742 RepID=UPI0021492795|nr:cytochrome b [Endozoicomonas sp. SESOKO1]